MWSVIECIRELDGFYKRHCLLGGLYWMIRNLEGKFCSRKLEELLNVSIFVLGIISVNNVFTDYVFIVFTYFHICYSFNFYVLNFFLL